MAGALPVELHLPYERRWDLNPQPTAWIVKVAVSILKLKTTARAVATSGGPYRNKTGRMKLERVIGIEPTTITLATWRSTS